MAIPFQPQDIDTISVFEMDAPKERGVSLGPPTANSQAVIYALESLQEKIKRIESEKVCKPCTVTYLLENA